MFILSIKFRFFKWIPLVYFKIFHRVEFHGQENVPAAGPVILASNHVSYYDPVLVGTGAIRDVEFMAWDKLFAVPILRSIIRFFGAFPVDASKADKSAYVNALRTLNDNKALIIFPEGTRSRDGTVKDFKLGVARIALKTNACIVPVTIVGAYEAFSRHRLLPRPWKISVYYHKPIRIARHEFSDANDRNEFSHKITAQVTEQINSRL